jgi:hypothetical protein
LQPSRKIEKGEVAMTLVAGIFSRNKNEQLSELTCEALKRSISRHPNDDVQVFKDSRSYFVKVDIGAFREPAAYLAPDGSLSLLAGEPLLLLDEEGGWQRRQDDLALIHEGFSREPGDVLKKAQGAFCAIHYQPGTGALSLIADKLGIRPLYYWIDQSYVIFASALRILEGLIEVPKRMDVRAVTEIVGLGYPLGDRTPYANIALLKAAEVVTIDERNVSCSSYWRWDEIEPSSQPEEHLLRQLDIRFGSSVARRIRDDKSTVSFLSGGLDSRCAVGALRNRNVRVHTFNFARPGTQDQIFGNDFAKQIGTIHKVCPKEPGDQVPDYSSLLGRARKTARIKLNQPIERPSLAWSGEGGSVSLGHVHMTQTISDLMRGGKMDAAIEEFFRREHVYVSPKLFKSEVFAGVINEGIRTELINLRHSDPARNFYLFLMLNDQRRKLSDHFENIDIHRVEYQLPFFDSGVLSQLMAVPIELCLGHKFYTKWLGYFPSAVTSVPWQTYPDHEPCPLPLPQGLDYQWGEKYLSAERTSQRRQQLIDQASGLLRMSDFPNEILSKRNLRLATWIHATGWRDYEHIIKAAQTYVTYWKTCEERHDFK